MKLAIALVLFFMSLLVFSQENVKIDSIDKVIEDKILKLNQKEFEKENQILNEIETLNDRRKNKYLIFIDNYKGKYQERKGEYILARSLYRKAYDTSIEINDYLGISKYYQNIGILNAKQSNRDSANFYFKKAVSNINENLSKIDENKALIDLSNLYSNLSTNYLLSKDYKNSIDYALRGLDLAQKSGNTRSQAIINQSVGLAFLHLKDYNKSQSYFEQFLNLSISLKDDKLIAICYLNMASVYTEKKQYSKAEELIKQSIQKNIELQDFENQCTAKQSLFTIYKLQGKFKDAHLIEDEIVECINKLGWSKSNFLIDLAEIYTKEENFNTADKYFSLAEKELKKRNETSTKFFKQKANYYKEIGELKKAIDLRDEELRIASQNNISEFTKKISEYEVKYRTAEKEAQIKTQQLQLEKEKYNKILLISALGVLLLFSLGGYFWNRNRQKSLALQNQNELLKLQQNFNQLELQNLNQQLDPHEVKNLLASISPEIQEKAPDAYQKMLKLFKLTRATLNNKSMTESLDIQLQQIEDYLSLEKTMLNQPLHFNIDNQIIEKEVQIPRLLLKNLVENALKHGIKNKTGEGHIQILTLEKKQNYHIIIDDDGVGRKKSIALDTGLGTGTYQNLFAILNQKNKSKADLEIIDKEHGTKVVVKIPVDYKYV